MEKNNVIDSRFRVGLTQEVIRYEDYMRIVSQNMYPDEADLLGFAYQLAKRGILGRKRRDLTLTFDHWKRVSLITMVEFKIYKPEPAIVGLFHDFKEDAHMLTWRMIDRVFGRDVYRGVRFLTKEDGKQGPSYYDGLRRPDCDWWIMAVKFADVLDNGRFEVWAEPERVKKQVLEVETVYLPMLPILGKKIEIATPEYDFLPEYIKQELEWSCARARKKMLDMHQFKF